MVAMATVNHKPPQHSDRALATSYTQQFNKSVNEPNSPMATEDMSAAETMVQIASRALDVEHDERAHMEELQILGLDHSCALPPPVIESRVFQRLYRYHLLSPRRS